MTERMTRAAYAKKWPRSVPASFPARWKRRKLSCSSTVVSSSVLRPPPRSCARACARRSSYAAANRRSRAASSPAWARWISCDNSSADILRQVQGDQEIFEQVFQEADFILQAMIAVEDVQRAAVAAREVDALL